MTTDTVGPKAEQTRRAILDAAIERYGRDGYRASSVAAIARDAGVTRSLAYTYFGDGEALFRAALDQDIAAVIEATRQKVVERNDDAHAWREDALAQFLEALDSHALARRVMAGLEPDVTSHMLQLPALETLRGAVGARLTDGQQLGLVRTDVDPAEMGRAAVTLWLGLIMSIVQFGLDGVAAELGPVRSLFDAAMCAPEAPDATHPRNPPDHRKAAPHGDIGDRNHHRPR